jgi:hypothetical protein
MISSSIVLDKLTSSFQTLPYPGDLNLVYDNTGYHLECVDIQQAFAGKHWSELSQETLIRESSALAFLTPEAFRFIFQLIYQMLFESLMKVMLYRRLVSIT